MAYVGPRSASLVMSTTVKELALSQECLISNLYVTMGGNTLIDAAHEQFVGDFPITKTSR